eukprot:TRINITY_DN192_c0_g2_i1.p1 TRINITY_DN192_c0_g2~~TRINITY_DN192_c0_g2_i1.p1  ORF type:complete len:110 (-),score=5.63 TRINITY_DN192_c0_g2_i1:116-445(-)
MTSSMAVTRGAGSRNSQSNTARVMGNVALRRKTQATTVRAEKRSRTVRLHFREPSVAKEHSHRLKRGTTTVSESIFEQSLFVTSAQEFERCMDWKYKDTTDKWNALADT